MLAHAGMVGAAGAILKDLDDLGILPTLILGKSAGKAAAGDGKGQDVGAVMSTALDTKVGCSGSTALQQEKHTVSGDLLAFIKGCTRSHVSHVYPLLLSRVPHS